MLIDEFEERLPPVLKWALAGVGAAAGWYYAQEHHSTIPLSCIIAGAAAGFCLVGFSFAGLRLLRFLLILFILVAVLNYAVLVPYGLGDHLPGWFDTGRTIFDWLKARDWPRPAF